MNYHGLTDRLPKLLFVTSLPSPQWGRRATESMQRALGAEGLATYLQAGLPPLRRLRLDKINRKIISVHTSVQCDPGAYVTVQGKPRRVATIGRPFLDMLRAPDLCGGIYHIQRCKQNPPRADATFPTIQVTIGYADKDDRNAHKRLLASRVPTTIRLDYSLNEPVGETDLFELEAGSVVAGPRGDPVWVDNGRRARRCPLYTRSRCRNFIDSARRDSPGSPSASGYWRASSLPFRSGRASNRMRCGSSPSTAIRSPSKSRSAWAPMP
jgi:hypothetical protein